MGCENESENHPRAFWLGEESVEISGGGGLEGGGNDETQKCLRGLGHPMTVGPGGDRVGSREVFVYGFP